MEQRFAFLDFFQKLLPPGLQGNSSLILLAILGGAGLFLLLILVVLFRLLFGGKKKSKPQQSLREKLAEYPKAPALTGDRRLLVEGVPVRLRLVVLAPSGEQSTIDPDTTNEILERVVMGLGSICSDDKPRVRVWPKQVSYQGFGRQFQNETIIPEGKDEPSPWVCLAGRVKLGKHQVMLGLALQASKPTTVGRRILDAHEWATVLRIRTRD